MSLAGRSKMKTVKLSDKSEVLAREWIKKMRPPSQNYERLIEELIKDKFDKTKQVKLKSMILSTYKMLRTIGTTQYIISKKFLASI